MIPAEAELLLDTSKKKNQDEIHLENFILNAVIGILPKERISPQPIIVHIILKLDAEEAAQSGDLAASVDYSDLVKAVGFILQQGRFLLLESAGVALARFILARATIVDAVTVNLTKPEALVGHGIPRVVITRHRSELRLPPSETQNANIFECPETSLVLMRSSSCENRSDAASHVKNDSRGSSAAELYLTPNHLLKIVTREPTN